MPRRKRTPEEIVRKAKVRELMQELDIHDMSDINTLFKEFVGDVLENGLEAELDDELGYSKYDYRNKETDNS
jgi:putative transposase